MDKRTKGENCLGCLGGECNDFTWVFLEFKFTLRIKATKVTFALLDNDNDHDDYQKMAEYWWFMMSSVFIRLWVLMTHAYENEKM